MGSPDERQIDGIGGGHPLTSKVAVISPSADDRADVDYLFLQVVPGRADRHRRPDLRQPARRRRPVRHRARPGPPSPATPPRCASGSSTPRSASSRPGCRRPAGGCATTATPSWPAPRFPRRRSTSRSPATTGPVFPTGRLVDRVRRPGGHLCRRRACRWCCCVPPTSASTGTESPGGPRGRRGPAVHSGGRPARRPAERWASATCGTRPSPRSRIVSPPRHGGTVTTRTFIPHRVHDRDRRARRGLRRRGRAHARHGRAAAGEPVAGHAHSNTRPARSTSASTSTPPARRPACVAAPSCARPASCPTASSGPAVERQPDERSSRTTRTAAGTSPTSGRSSCTPRCWTRPATSSST